MSNAQEKSSFRKLAELTDKAVRAQFLEEPVYYLSEGRLDNMLFCLESGAERIKKLEEFIKKARKEVVFECNEFGGEDYCVVPEWFMTDDIV